MSRQKRFIYAHLSNRHGTSSYYHHWNVISLIQGFVFHALLCVCVCECFCSENHCVLYLTPDAVKKVFFFMDTRKKSHSILLLLSYLFLAHFIFRRKMRYCPSVTVCQKFFFMNILFWCKFFSIIFFKDIFFSKYHYRILFLAIFSFENLFFEIF